nr:TlpA disulfide reductase family protein [uncultured Polaribacter sp.]
MKIYIYVLFFVPLLFSCKKEAVKDAPKTVTSVKSYSYKELKPMLERQDGKTYVINFWATWCAPCVKELPAFEKLNKEYAAKNVEVILVSLDFPKQVEKRLLPFINKKNLQSKVILLDDVNEDAWIKEIDSAWSGAIPATLIYSSKGRKFYEQSFDYELLETELKTLL